MDAETRSFRIEWRENAEQGVTGAAIAHVWSVRWLLYAGLAFAAAALVALALSGDGWSALAAAPLAAMSGFLFHRWARALEPIDRAKVRAWIVARRAKKNEGFREQAAATDAIEGEVLHTVRADAEGVLWTARSAESRVRWAGITRIALLRAGHVVFVGRAPMGHLLVPAWAFEADEQRALFVAHARAWLRSADPQPRAPESPPALEPRSSREIELDVAWTLASLIEQLRAVAVPFSDRAYYAVGTLMLLGFAYLACPPALRAVVPPSVAIALALFAVALYTSTWVRALRALPGVRGHVRTRARFSELGASFASALQTSVRSWRYVALQRLERATLIDGVIVPDAWLAPEDIAEIVRWKDEAAAKEPSQPPPAPKKQRKLVFVMIPAVVAFVALYRIVLSDPPPPIAPLPAESIVDEAPYPPVVPTPRIACDLPERVVPGAPLEQDMAVCARLSETLHEEDDVAVIQRCVAVGDATLGAAAVVWHRDRLALWENIRGSWRFADDLLRWTEHEDPHCDAVLHAIQLEAGGSPELLVALDCAMRPYAISQENVTTKSRTLSACGTARCWWTIAIAESRYAWETNECSSWGNDVHTVGTQDPSSVWTGDDRIVLARSIAAALDPPPGFVQPAIYTLVELSSYDVRGGPLIERPRP
jgi:hypothetical protein